MTNPSCSSIKAFFCFRNAPYSKTIIRWSFPPIHSIYYDAGCLGFLCIRRCARSGCPVGGYPTRAKTLSALGCLPSLYWSGIKRQKFLTFDYELINRFPIFVVVRIFTKSLLVGRNLLYLLILVLSECKDIKRFLYKQEFL